jgi:aerobic-type carbon monoxide dehydrogenase small subunit (CoxS/CutS family)
VGILKEKANPSEEELLTRMTKHICRCCSYPRILKAARRALAASKK